MFRILYDLLRSWIWKKDLLLHVNHYFIAAWFLYNSSLKPIKTLWYVILTVTSYLTLIWFSTSFQIKHVNHYKTLKNVHMKASLVMGVILIERMASDFLSKLNYKYSTGFGTGFKPVLFFLHLYYIVLSFVIFPGKILSSALQ